jgi:hypothetical protein
MLDAVSEEVLEEFDKFDKLETVRCDQGVRQRVQEVGRLVRDEAVLDWADLEILESVRSILRLCRIHNLGVVWLEDDAVGLC